MVPVRESVWEVRLVGVRRRSARQRPWSRWGSVAGWGAAGSGDEPGCGCIAHTWHALSMMSDHDAVGPGPVDATRRRRAPSRERSQWRQRNDA